MSAPVSARLDAATERMYALLPAHVRTEDAKTGWALKALISVLAVGSDEIDREIDTLLESMFVETAPEEALADIAALVASEPLRTLPPEAGFTSRTFIANTIRYRRGKGTARVLESLASDVAGVGSVAVEYFQRLARLAHLIDVRPERPGTATLVSGSIAAGTATARDALPRLVDVRSIARAAGRHHVPHVGVHVARPTVRSFAAPAPAPVYQPEVLAGVPAARPWADGGVARAGYFQLSEQPGRVLRLFNPDRHSQTERDRVVETDLPDLLRRLPLHLETEARRAAALGRSHSLGQPPWFDSVGQPFAIYLREVGSPTFALVAPEEVLIANLDAAPLPAGARPSPDRGYSWFEGGTAAAGPVTKTGKVKIRCGFDPVTGRMIVAEPIAGAPDVEEVRVAHSTGLGWEIGAGPQDRNSAFVPFDISDGPDLTNFIRIVDATKAETGVPTSNERAVATLDKALSEWAAMGQGKRGLIVLTRCDREGAAGAAADVPIKVHPGSELHVVSGQWRPALARPGLPADPQRRGYLVRRDRRFTIDAPVRITASSAPPAGGRAGVLILDGLELTFGLSIGVRALSRLLIRHSTVRSPGGSAISTTAPISDAGIEIERSIVGRVQLDFGAGVAAGDLVVADSIISSDGAAASAIAAASLDAVLRNVTVLGGSSFKSLFATNVLFEQPTLVTRRQAGCVRFCWVAAGSAVPRRYRCQPDLAIGAAAAKKGSDLTANEREAAALAVMPLFLDLALDEPTVAMLHPLASDAIRLGGEHDTEIGAFSSAAEGLRIANLTSLFDDYLPFGLEAGVIDDTRSSAIALRRNRP